MSSSCRSAHPTTAYICHNPLCTSRKTTFLSDKAFSIHLTLSPTCVPYVMASGKKRQAIPAAQAAPELDESVEITYKSNKRANLLRRDFVNDKMPGSLHEASMNLDTYADEYVIDDTSIDVDAEQSAEGTFLYTTDQKWTVALLKLLDDMNAPDYAFHDILKWARGANADNYSFFPDGGLSRSRNVDVIFKSLRNATQLLPSVQAVTVPHGSPCDVIAYDFVPQLLSLLQNSKIMVQDNLVIDMKNPLCPYMSPTGKLGEALSGSVYRNAYDHFISKPDRELFVPIIQWIDRTSVTGNDRFSLKPYMFTPAIFTEKFRRTIQAWGYHGFLPKPKISSAQNQTQHQGDNIRNYHAQLATVLQTFKTAGPRLKNVTLPLGPAGGMSVDIVTCILFVIQDMQEGDTLCGRYGPHTPEIQRHCRSCNVQYADLDNDKVECRYLFAIAMQEIAASNDKVLCARWSQHQLQNVFDTVPLADPVRGIYGATPVETMHAFRKGMIEQVTFLVLENVPASAKAALDTLALRFHKSHRQTYRNAYPATDFSNGITNLTKISASERLGLVFLFVILAQYDEGWTILSNTLQKRTTTKLDAIIELFECMLCFDAWLNQATYWSIQDDADTKSDIQAAIRKMMNMCTTQITSVKVEAKKRAKGKAKTGKAKTANATSAKPKSANAAAAKATAGKGKLGKTKAGTDTTNNDKPEKVTYPWKFPKFHELLHIVDDIERFGAPMNYCAQRPESLLISVAKQPGRRAQKRHAGSAYELQAAQRLSSSLIIDIMYEKIWKPSTAGTNGDQYISRNDELKDITGNATHGVLTCRGDPTTPSSYLMSWQTATDLSRMHLPFLLLHFLCQTFANPVRICTQFMLNKIIFRCHPSFQSDGPIHDWMKVKIGNDTIPCRLAAVVMLCEDNAKTQRLRLVVQRATKRTKV